MGAHAQREVVSKVDIVVGTVGEEGRRVRVRRKGVERKIERQRDETETETETEMGRKRGRRWRRGDVGACGCGGQTEGC